MQLWIAWKKHLINIPGDLIINYHYSTKFSFLSNYLPTLIKNFNKIKNFWFDQKFFILLKSLQLFCLQSTIN